MDVCVYMCVCIRACVYTCVRVCCNGLSCVFLSQIDARHVMAGIYRTNVLHQLILCNLTGVWVDV